MNEVKEVMMKIPVYAIDEKCENCPNLVLESLGKTVKCKYAHICWVALDMRDGERE